MVAQIIPFTPTATTPFQFQATLDGVNYSVVISWSLFGRRFYINCLTLNGVPVFTLPLISSPVYYDINLTAGYFATPIIFRDTLNQFEIGS